MVAPVVGRAVADKVQRTADVVVSSILLLIFVVPMVLIAIAVRLEDGGPALFRQERVGLGGGRFTMFKFRTMFQGGDDRRLRELIARELRGDMTLVGPRPCLDWEADMFPEEFQPRFSVRPGLTGLWQVSGRSTLGTLDMLRLDVRYIRNRSLRTDLAILLRTVPALLRSSGAR